MSLKPSLCYDFSTKDELDGIRDGVDGVVHSLGKKPKMLICSSSGFVNCMLFSLQASDLTFSGDSNYVIPSFRYSVGRKAAVNVLGAAASKPAIK